MYNNKFDLSGFSVLIFEPQKILKEQIPLSRIYKLLLAFS